MTTKRWGRWMVMGLPFLLGAVMFAAQAEHSAKAGSLSAVQDEIIRYVRQRFGVPATTSLAVQPFQNSEFKDFYKTRIVVNNGKSVQEAYVTKDGKYLILGNIYTLGADPRTEVERQINLRDQEAVGPENAPVTIVEYADLECPMCAHMQQFLDKDLLPKYGDKVRIVFKEFPLVQIHDWALTAAIADACAYQINRSAFLPYRASIFENQGLINGANVRTLLLDFGERAGIDRLKLASCVDTKATLPRVEASTREGQALGVNSTPTLFVNGRIVLGAPPPDQFYKIVDEAMHAPR